MARYATLTEGGVVDTVYLHNPPEGAVQIPDGVFAGHRRIGDEWQAPPPAPVSTQEVDDERDRRIAVGVTFAGVLYQTRASDRENISGAALLASMAIAGGAQSGDLYWHGGQTPFQWIAADNSVTDMDAQTVVAFGQAAAEHVRAHIFAARALKNMSPIPADYRSDIYWPEGA